MEVSVKYLLVFLFLIGCEGNMDTKEGEGPGIEKKGEETKEDLDQKAKEGIGNNLVGVTAKKDLPDCNEKNKDKIYYVGEKDGLFKCDENHKMVPILDQIRVNKEMIADINIRLPSYDVVDSDGNLIGITTADQALQFLSGSPTIIVRDSVLAVHALKLNVRTGFVDKYCGYAEDSCAGKCVVSDFHPMATYHGEGNKLYSARSESEATLHEKSDVDSFIEWVDDGPGHPVCTPSGSINVKVYELPELDKTTSQLLENYPYKAPLNVIQMLINDPPPPLPEP